MNGDQQLRKQIIAELKKHPDIADAKVAVQDGFVVLQSAQEHGAVKRGIQEILKRIKHPKAFLIESAASGKPNKDGLSFQIIKALQRNDDMKTGDIVIDISGDQVYLEGTVSYPSRRSAIGKTIWEVKGVKGICNRLNVENEPNKKPLRSPA